MKKVSGFMDSRPLGCYKFTFYVEDDATNEEIASQVEAVCDYHIHWDVEPGYVAEQQTVYRKKEAWE